MNSALAIQVVAVAIWTYVGMRVWEWWMDWENKDAF
jgi:hypothetical protein